MSAIVPEPGSTDPARARRGRGEPGAVSVNPPRSVPPAGSCCARSKTVTMPWPPNFVNECGAKG
jgi:hypothetical protein